MKTKIPPHPPVMQDQDHNSYTAPTLTILLSLIVIVGAAIAALINLYI